MDSVFRKLACEEEKENYDKMEKEGICNGEVSAWELPLGE
jgi:hypothetical protein